ncbi:hypothetical protein WJX84_008007 [Apatococcus fuscideae]|uniref:Uncharacterized protein n=1 Tax=Apatococcus fuscideae TaxID=2026836 RepID=A0AAW1TG15_9CHLO
MWAFYIPAISCVILAVLFTLRRYADPKTPIVVRLVAIISWVTSLSIVALVPLDVWTTLSVQKNPALGILWSICYWSTQVLTWFLIPFFQGYFDAGNFSKLGKSQTSLRNSLTHWAVIGVLGGIGLAFLLITGRLTIGSIPNLAIQLSNTYGLIVITLLLSYGLVEIPRFVWRTSEPEVRLRYCCHRIGRAAEKLEDAAFELIRVATVVEATSQPMPKRDPLRPYMDQIYQQANEWSPIKPAQCPKDEQGRVDLDDLTDKDLDYGCDLYGLASLRQRLRRATDNYKGLNAEYINQVMDGFELEAVCKARRTGDYNIQTGPTSKPQAKLATALMMYRAVVRPWSRKLLALLLASLSAVIVWSEATIGSGRHPDLSPFSLAIHAARLGEFGTQLLVMLPLAYMCAANYYSIFKLGMFSFYLLVPHATQPASLLLNASLVCRFITPLCYNFLHVIRMHVPEADGQVTVFSQKMGAAMQEVPVFRQEFNSWFPLVTVVVCLIVLLNAWDYAARFVVSSRYRFDEDSAVDEFSERGRLLMRHEQDGKSRGMPLGDCLGLWGSVEAPISLTAARARASGGKLMGIAKSSRSATGPSMPSTQSASLGRAASNPRPASGIASSSTDGITAATTVARSARAGISNLTRSFIQKKNNSGEQSSPAGSRAVGNMGSSKPPPSGLDGIFARMNSDGTSSTRRAESNSDRIDDDTDDGGLLGSQPDSLYGAAGSSGGWLPRRR